MRLELPEAPVLTSSQFLAKLFLILNGKKIRLLSAWGKRENWLVGKLSFLKEKFSQPSELIDGLIKVKEKTKTSRKIKREGRKRKPDPSLKIRVPAISVRTNL